MNLHGEEDEDLPLLAGAQAAKQPGSKKSASSSYTSDDDLAGPVVTGGRPAKLGYCSCCHVSHLSCMRLLHNDKGFRHSPQGLTCTHCKYLRWLQLRWLAFRV